LIFLKAASTVTKKFPKAASTYINGLLKALDEEIFEYLSIAVAFETFICECYSGCPVLFCDCNESFPNLLNQ
jgi:hypothetical protein